MKNAQRFSILLAVLVAAACAALIPVGGGSASSSCCAPKAKGEGPRMSTKGSPAMVQFSEFSSAPPEQPVDLVFLHHSIGGHLLSDLGPDDGRWHVHPNGGGLRTLLTKNNYRVHDATYGSKLGEHTDIFDWLPKFRDHMPDVLRIEEQDKQLPAGQPNRVVLFKSCYPNNYFEPNEGSAPSESGPALTVANAQATLNALLPIFRAHPDTLFVFLTTPPLVGEVPDEPAYKWLIKRALGRPDAKETLRDQGQRSRQFATWVASPEGWLKDYAEKNVVVFDYFKLLSGDGASNFLQYPTGGGFDNHPSAEGNHKAAEALVPLLNRAVRRAGILPPGEPAKTAQNAP